MQSDPSRENVIDNCVGLIRDMSAQVLELLVIDEWSYEREYSSLSIIKQDLESLLSFVEDRRQYLSRTCGDL